MSVSTHWLLVRLYLQGQIANRKKHHRNQYYKLLPFLIKWNTKNTTMSEQNPIKKTIERDKIDTLNTQMHDRSHSWLCTDTSIKSGGDELGLWVKGFPLTEMMRSYKCFPHVSKIPTLACNPEINAITNKVIILKIIVEK
jgi:hypothetical protein